MIKFDLLPPKISKLFYIFFYYDFLIFVIVKKRTNSKNTAFWYRRFLLSKLGPKHKAKGQLERIDK